MSEVDDAIEGHYNQRNGRASVTTPSISYINEDGLPDSIMTQVRANQEIASEIERWTQSLNQGGQQAPQDVFNRNRWSLNTGVFAQMSQSAWAVEHDDILSTLGDVTEGLTFAKTRFELNDDDQQDIWSQWARDVDLDSRLREQFRELYKVSQFYCLPASTLIYTPSGPKEISQVCPGDWVWSVDDSTKSPTLVAARVRVAAKTGRRSLICITTSNQSLDLTEDHPVLIASRNGNRDNRRNLTFDWIDAGKLTVGDVVLTFASDFDRPVHDREPSRDVARIVGALIADGGHNKRYGVPSRYSPTGPTQFTLCAPPGSVKRSTWVPLIEQTFDVEVHASEACCVRFCTTDLHEWCAEVMRYKSPDRFVPDWVWRASRKTQSAFLQGYLEGDGTDDGDGQWRVRCTSERLVRELRVLCVAIGYTTGNIARRVTTSGYHIGAEFFEFPLYQEGQRRQVPSSYAKCRLEMDEHLNLRTIVSVTDLSEQGEMDVYDLSIEGTQNFIAEGVVVHNCGLWWEKKIYNVRDAAVQAALDEVKTKLDAKDAEALGQPAPSTGPGKGNRKRKKTFPVEMPTAITVFDPTKIMPVGQLMFGKERFAYIASRGEHETFTSVMTGSVADSAVLKLLEGQYTPTAADRKACADVGADSRNLWLMREDAVYRHTLTRAQYERWASVRLKSVLPILEMKAHLRSSDRASLVGSTNFIVLIRKGTDKLPAKPAEIANLHEQARLVARLPVLVGDHRLSVEIVTPSIDKTLTESRWQVLDSRLVFRALASFQPIVQGGAAGSGVKEMSLVIAAGLQNRRHMLLRSIEANIFAKILERNAGTLDEFPSLAFAPKRITLDFSADIMNAVLKLRDRGDISRETTLDEFDYSQDVEVLRRAQEKVSFDDIFQSGTPYASPVSNPYAGADEPVPGAEPSAVPVKAVPVKAPAKTVAKATGRPPGVKDTKPRVPRGQLKS